MTTPQKMKRLYILLKWYDYFRAVQSEEVPEEDFKLALQLQHEMHALQAEALRAKKKKIHTVQAKRPKTKSKLK